MSLEFNRTILYSKNKEELSVYLSELLDASLNKKTEGIEIKKEDFSLMIYDRNSKKSNYKSTFHFSLSSQDELKEMLKKIQFIWFRRGKNENAPEILEKNEKGKHHSFFKTRDIDGNNWIFSCGVDT